MPAQSREHRGRLRVRGGRGWRGLADSNRPDRAVRNAVIQRADRDAARQCDKLVGRLRRTDENDACGLHSDRLGDRVALDLRRPRQVRHHDDERVAAHGRRDAQMAGELIKVRVGQVRKNEDEALRMTAGQFGRCGMRVVAELLCCFADVGARCGAHATATGQRLEDETSGDARSFRDIRLCHGTLSCGHGHLLYSHTIRKVPAGREPCRDFRDAIRTATRACRSSPTPWQPRPGAEPRSHRRWTAWAWCLRRPRR